MQKDAERVVEFALLKDICCSRRFVLIGSLHYYFNVQFEFAFTDGPAYVPHFAVRSIYHVNADNSYDVEGVNRGRYGHLALRTFRGRGRARHNM